MLKTLTRGEPLEISKEETPSLSSLLQSALVHGHGHGRSRELLATPLWSGRGRVWSSACTPPPPPTPAPRPLTQLCQRFKGPSTNGAFHTWGHRHPDDGKPRQTPTVPHGPRHKLSARQRLLPPCLWTCQDHRTPHHTPAWCHADAFSHTAPSRCSPPHRATCQVSWTHADRPTATLTYAMPKTHRAPSRPRGFATRRLDPPASDFFTTQRKTLPLHDPRLTPPG